MDTSSPDGILGLFPAFEELGGVQASGRVAWDCIARLGIGDCGLRNAHLFSYGRNGKVTTDTSTGRSNITRATSKLRAVAAALTRKWPAQLVLVWHIDLIKLVPLFRNSNATVVLFLHGVEAWRRQDPVDRALLRRVDLFLSNSDFTWRQFVKINHSYSAAPHRTVPLGIAAAVARSLPSPGVPPVTLMLGRLVKKEGYKGHQEMISAWRLVLQQSPEAKLWIAGEGDLRPKLELLAKKHGVQASVRFWGIVSEEKKQELLARSRCLALPSRGEGFGIVYLEAMRMGRPCLVSTLDAGREVVDPPNAGLAADPSNPAELAGAVCRLLCDGPEWTRLSRQARERYETYFTAKHFQERLLAVLSTLN